MNFTRIIETVLAFSLLESLYNLTSLTKVLESNNAFVNQSHLELVLGLSYFLPNIVKRTLRLKVFEPKTYKCGLLLISNANSALSVGHTLWGFTCLCGSQSLIVWCSSFEFLVEVLSENFYGLKQREWTQWLATSKILNPKASLIGGKFKLVWPHNS